MNGIEKLCLRYGLGELCEEPQEVVGGLLHKMYRVKTKNGEYAVKRLNPEIMKRAKAMQNMISSEKVARAACGDIPVIAAKEWNGEQLLCLEGSYYMIFDWLDGASVYPPQITKKHCKSMGQVLGKLHAKQLCVDTVEKESGIRSLIPWETYLCEAKKQQTSWLAVYEEMLPQLLHWDKQVTQAIEQLVKEQVISHRDLDPKNVLWREETPYIIDWEAAGYVNPDKELAEVVFYWAADTNGTLEQTKVQALLAGYTEYRSVADADWNVVLACSCEGMLGWLEYCVKRALGMEIGDERERKQGVEQMLGTMKELRRWAEQTEQLKHWLTEA
ncbi:MAG: phosphotransferase [Lachnospiraceae bacterium]|nr:phosphotransferase [Lachnospiraceae bacterium]